MVNFSLECRRVLAALGILAALQVSPVFAGSVTADPGPLPEPVKAVQPLPASADLTSPTGYTSQYRTVAHAILDQEKALGGVDDNMYRLIDNLIDQAKAKIQLRPVPSDRILQDAYAVEQLKAIDELLVANNFVYPGVGLTDLLSDSLTPKEMTSDELKILLHHPHNLRRQQHIRGHAEEPFYVSDCDTASFIYVAIGEAVGLPISMVEVPEHNFVRWYFEDGSYVNWETMDGEARSDAAYQQGYRIPSSLIERNVFLAKMSREDMLGYSRFVVGLGWQKRNDCSRAANEYRAATKAYGRVPSSWNNLAWVIVTCRDSDFRNGKKAVQYALRAVEIWRSANALDTLAFSYAEIGDFDKAIEIETEAYQLEPKLEYRQAIEGFRQGKTWVEQHPEQESMHLPVWGNR